MTDEGNRVELIRTSDDYTQLEPGATGTVTGIDVDEFPGQPPTRKVWVDWDDGSSLALIQGEDKWKTLDDDE